MVNCINFSNEPITKVFRNNGGDSFTDIGATIAPVSNGISEFVDLNNDGYTDIFETGTDLSGNPSTLYYINDKKGGFSPSGKEFKNLKNSHASFGDYNNDGYTDISITGEDPNGVHTYVYKNMGSAGFTEIGIIYNNPTYNQSHWFDYDNDKDLDLLMTSDNSWRVSNVVPEDMIYKNTGDDTFEKDLTFKGQLKYAGYSALSLFRYDADSDIDFIQSVFDPATSSYKLVIFNNLCPLIKSAPSAPSGLSAEIAGNKVILSWNNTDQIGRASCRERV